MMADPRFFNRNNSFMNPSASSYKSDFAIALRKSKRNSFVSQKRKENLDSFEDYCLYIGDLPPRLLTLFPALSSADSELSKLTNLKRILEIEDLIEEDSLEILTILGKSLTNESISSRNIFLEVGLLHTLVQIVKTSKHEESVGQALYCLCNIAASKDKFSEEILKTGVLVKLLEWVQKGSLKVKENGIWTLANMLGGCKELAETLLGKNFLDLLVEVSIENKEIAEGITLSLSNLTRDLSGLSINHIDLILVLCEKIKKSGNFTYLWTLSNLTKGEDWILDKIIQKSLPEFAFRGILSENQEMNEPCALILCNLAGGNRSHSDFLLAHQIFEVISAAFERAEDHLLFFIYNLLRNIVVDNLDAVNQLRKSKLLVVCISELSGKTMKVQKEACFFLLNFSHHLTIEDEGFISKLLAYVCICLENLDIDIVQSSLNIVFNILSLKPCKFLSLSEDLGLLNLIEDLQQHPNELISDSSSFIINEFL